MNKLDQYNNPIPNDLVIINSIRISQLVLEEPSSIDKLNKLKWYGFKGNKTPHIFVSYLEADKISSLIGSLLADSSSPKDFFPLADLVLINSVLHRYSISIEDGFYWA